MDEHEDNNYVVVKLVTGEQIIGELLYECKEGISVFEPILLKMLTHSKPDGTVVERTMTSTYCQLTEDKEFMFDWKDIVFCKRLHSGLVDFYTKLVLALEEEDKNIDEEFDDTLEDQLLNKSNIKLH